VSVAGVNLPLAKEMKLLGVVLDQRLPFEKQFSAVARSRNYHGLAIRHIRRQLSTEFTTTLADIGV